MSSIIREGDTFHGISVFGRGVFTSHNYEDLKYAGQCKDGYACGLGMATRSSGTKEYAEHGPHGQYDGRYLDRWAHGDTRYSLFERSGERKESAFVWANGRCAYNGEGCVRDDPRLLALIAQVAPVEVRPAARAPHPPLAAHSPPSNRPMDRRARFARRRRWRPPWPPRCTPMPHAVVGRVTQAKSSRTAPHDHAVTRARTDLT